MTWLVAGIVVVFGLFLSALYSGSETGLYRVNRLRLHLAVQQGKPSAKRLARVLRDEPGALAVTLIGTNIANYITTATVAYVFSELVGTTATRSELLTVVVMTPMIFVFAEMVPKNLFQAHADVLLARGSCILATTDRVCRLTGAVWLLTRLAGAINRLSGTNMPTQDTFGPKRRIALMLREALAGRELYEEQSDLIDNVCELSETQIHSIMVPRNRIVTIAADADRKELVRVAKRTGHARLPVYGSSPRNVIGTVRVDQLLQLEGWKTVDEGLRKAIFVGPHETVAASITKLRRARRGVAIVTDRGGKMLGLITLKDLLKELVGEVAEGV